MQTDTLSLSRERDLPVALDFLALLEIGIRRAQATSGETWTDFNKHDPGVTILEQVCYALVDIAYRASHPVVDIIDTVFAETDRTPGGKPATGRAARMATDFAMPAIALSSAPVTTGDFEALLADTFPELRAVWITATDVSFAADATTMPGQRVEALAYPADGGSDQRATATEDDILTFMERHRLLGQHIAGVRLLRPVPFRFSARVEAAAGQDPDDLIVDVLHNIDMALCPPMLFRSRDSLSDMPPDALFEGPLLRAGRAASWDAPRTPPARTVSWLQRIILDTPGIAAVHHVTIDTADAGDGGCLVLDRQTPQTGLMVSTGADGIRATGALRLGTGGETSRQGHIMAGLNHRLSLIREEMDRYRRRSAEILAGAIPPGRVRPRLGEYRPVQHDFPAVYQLGAGSGTRDTPGMATGDDIRNLRAYLTLLEQPLADMLQQIRLAPELLSSGPGEGSALITTYAQAALNGAGQTPPGFEDLLRNAQEYPGDLAHHISKPDPHGLRYEDFLDHLLARFDESFATATLQKFDPPTKDGKRAGARDRIRAKQAFVRELTAPSSVAGADANSPGLTTHRGSATGTNTEVSALARRIQLKTLLDTPPVVLEHHLLAGARPKKADHNAFFRFSGYPGPSGFRGSIALRIHRSGQAAFCDVFLHDRKRLPSPASAPGRLRDLMAHTFLDVRQAQDTSVQWHIWRSAGGQGIDLVLLTPPQAARDAVFEHFASLPDLLSGPEDDITISPLLFPAGFGAWQMTVTARTRAFAAPDATAAFEEFVEETVLEEAPALMNTWFFPARLWPEEAECDNALVMTNYDEFCEAVTALRARGGRTAENAEQVRLARTVAELAWRQHIDALSVVLDG